MNPNNLIKSNLRIRMAMKGVKTLKELERIAGVSWKIVSKLDDEKGADIDSIQLRNLLKICTALECKLEELIEIDYENLLKK